MLGRKELVARCLTKKLLAYATGRIIEFTDRPAITAIVAQSKPSEFGLRDLVHLFIQSDAFLHL